MDAAAFSINVSNNLGGTVRFYCDNHLSTYPHLSVYVLIKFRGSLDLCIPESIPFDCKIQLILQSFHRHGIQHSNNHRLQLL